MPKHNFNTAKKILETYTNKSSLYWENTEQKRLQAVFLQAVKVPAYRNFLSKHFKKKFKFSLSTFKTLPYMSKRNYFHAYSYHDMIKYNAYDNNSLVLTSTSGSTGTPTYFPRNEIIDWQYSVLAEYFITNGSKGSTLLIDCFGMGVWIGGLITYQAFRYAALRKNVVSIITPGINKKEIFNALRNLAPHFDNVILAGYPPFIKDLVDESFEENINFKKFHVRLLFAAESFTEDFRDYLCKATSIKNPYLDTLNIYGSAELGAMAFETPLSIFIRRKAIKYPKLYNQLFYRHKLPTLAQYNPNFVCFEEDAGRILITADNANPFVRYDIGDSGGVYSFDQIRKIFSHFDIDLIKQANIENISILQLPFVYIYERNDFSTTLYGLQIYPETIKKALSHVNLRKYLTEKFKLETSYDKKGNQFLQIHIELKPQKRPSKSLKKYCVSEIIKQLLIHNSEFKELTKMIGEKRTRPRIQFWPYNHPLHFPSGIKQMWIKK